MHHHSCPKQFSLFQQTLFVLFCKEPFKSTHSIWQKTFLICTEPFKSTHSMPQKTANYYLPTSGLYRQVGALLTFSHTFQSPPRIPSAVVRSWLWTLWRGHWTGWSERRPWPCSRPRAETGTPHPAFVGTAAHFAATAPPFAYTSQLCPILSYIFNNNKPLQWQTTSTNVLPLPKQ